MGRPPVLKEKSNCYGYVLGIPSPLCPGLNGEEDKHLNDVFSWTEGGAARTLKKAKHELTKAILHDGLKTTGAKKNHITAWVVTNEDGTMDFHFMKHLPHGRIKHQLGHGKDRLSAGGINEAVSQMKAANSKIKSVDLVGSFFIPNYGLKWEADYGEWQARNFERWR